MKNTLLFSLAMFALALNACSPVAEPAEVTRLVEVPATVIVTQEVTREVPVTRQVEIEVTREVQVTRLAVATATSPPTEAPAAGPTPPRVEDAIAVNFVGQATTGPLTVEVGRVLFVDREVFVSWIEEEGGDSEWLAEMGDSPVIGELILKITNNGDQLVRLWPIYHGAVTVNGEQIRLADFRQFRLGNELDEEFLPGATSIGGLYFGVSRTALSDINSFAYYTLRNPYVPEPYAELGPTISIAADLSEHVWEPYPEELR